MYCYLLQVGLPPGHEPSGHLQLWPDSCDLPDRGPGLLHPGQQLRGEEFCAAHCLCAQGGEVILKTLKCHKNFDLNNYFDCFIRHLTNQNNEVNVV